MHEKAPSPGRLRRPPSPAGGEGMQCSPRRTDSHPHGVALSPRGRGRRGEAEPGEGAFAPHGTTSAVRCHFISTPKKVWREKGDSLKSITSLRTGLSCTAWAMVNQGACSLKITCACS